MEAFAIATKFHSVALLTHPQHKSKLPLQLKTHFFCHYPLITLCKLSAFPVNRTWPRSYAYACSCSNSNSNTFAIHGDGEAGHDRTVRVKLILHKECEFGEEFSAVGEDVILGSWDPLSAIPMTWSPGHIWATPTMDLPVGKSIYFKFILTDKEGEIQWQPGPDRVLKTWETRAILLVSQDWDDINLQTIREEEMNEQIIRVTEQEIAETGIEDCVRETQDAGVRITEEGEISGEVPVLVPGLTSAYVEDWDDINLQTITKKEMDEQVRVTEQEITETGIEDWVRKTQEAGVGIAEGGNISGEVPVLVPGLTSVYDADGACSTIGEVPDLVPGLTTMLDAHGDSLAKEVENAWKYSVAIMAAEEEEEESPSFVENGSATPNNHTSLSDEGEASTSSATETFVIVEEEETSTSSAKELIENKDPAASSKSSCNEREQSNTVNYESSSSPLQKDFDWGRDVLSKLMWSLGLKE